MFVYSTFYTSLSNIMLRCSISPLFAHMNLYPYEDHTCQNDRDTLCRVPYFHFNNGWFFLLP